LKCTSSDKDELATIKLGDVI